MGTDDLDGPDPWGLPSQGGPLDDGAADTETSWQEMVLTTPIGVYAVYGDGDD